MGARYGGPVSGAARPPGSRLVCLHSMHGAAAECCRPHVLVFRFQTRELGGSAGNTLLQPLPCTQGTHCALCCHALRCWRSIRPSWSPSQWRPPCPHVARAAWRTHHSVSPWGAGHAAGVGDSGQQVPGGAACVRACVGCATEQTAVCGDAAAAPRLLHSKHTRAEGLENLSLLTMAARAASQSCMPSRRMINPACACTPFLPGASTHAGLW